MEALRWYARNDIRIDDVPEPTPGPGQLLVEVSACGICGSDVKEWLSGPVVVNEHEHPFTRSAPPITLGHEFAGVIVGVGFEVTGWRAGERVALEAELRCGHCWQCQRGNYHLCEMAAYLGFNADGGLARYVVFDARQAIKIPDGVSDEAAATLEPLAVAIHAVRRGALDFGATAAVIGAGAVGLGVVAACRAQGAASLTAIDLLPRRRELASKIGAEYVLSDLDEAGEFDRDPQLSRAGGYDVVFECSGHPASLAHAISLTHRGGTIVTVGLFADPVTLDLNEVTMNERQLRGSLGYNGDFQRALRLLETGGLDAEELVTARVPLRDSIQGAFGELHEHGADHVKILVLPSA